MLGRIEGEHWSGVKRCADPEVEKEDYIQILKILEIDEEEKIKKIKNSKDYKNYLELENNVKEINESTNLFLLVKDNKDKILSLK